MIMLWSVAENRTASFLESEEITRIVNKPPPFNVLGRILTIFGLRGHSKQRGGIYSRTIRITQDGQQELTF